MPFAQLPARVNKQAEVYLHKGKSFISRRIPKLEATHVGSSQILGSLLRAPKYYGIPTVRDPNLENYPY